MPFGLSLAVLNLTRTPTLHTAFIRRATATAASAFFEDTGIVDCRGAAMSAQLAVKRVYNFAGTKLDPTKSQDMISQRIYLGLTNDVGAVRVDGEVMLCLRPDFKDSVQALLNDCFDKQQCTSGQRPRLEASSTRVLLQHSVSVAEEVKPPYRKTVLRRH